MDKSITYVGLDAHKDTIAVALAEADAHKDVREYGKIANTADGLERSGGEAVARRERASILL